jgi:hypothetical protein
MRINLKGIIVESRYGICFKIEKYCTQLKANLSSDESYKNKCMFLIHELEVNAPNKLVFTIKSMKLP